MLSLWVPSEIVTWDPNVAVSMTMGGRGLARRGTAWHGLVQLCVAWRGLVLAWHRCLAGLDVGWRGLLAWVGLWFVLLRFVVACCGFFWFLLLVYYALFGAPDAQSHSSGSI